MNLADYIIVFAFPSFTFWVGSIFFRWVGSAEEIDSGEHYHILPRSAAGKAGLSLFFAVFLVFATGVLLGSRGASSASVIAVAAMVLYFAGALWRACTN